MAIRTSGVVARRSKPGAALEETGQPIEKRVAANRIAGQDVGPAAGTWAAVACYVRGTRILTINGEIPIEDLRVGDIAITASGYAPALHPIRWIGCRHVDLDRSTSAAAFAPIRVRTDAFGPGRPTRDLLLSPEHAVFVTDAAGPLLVPIRCLVNGRTICQEAARGLVTYYHVELDQHDILLANNLPAESYLDTGRRHEFSNAGIVQPPFVDLSEMPARTPLRMELLLAGPRVEKLRAALQARGGGPGRARRRDPDRRVH